VTGLTNSPRGYLLAKTPRLTGALGCSFSLGAHLDPLLATDLYYGECAASDVKSG
jgi:hypothetical protein